MRENQCSIIKAKKNQCFEISRQSFKLFMREDLQEGQVEEMCCNHILIKMQ